MKRIKNVLKMLYFTIFLVSFSNLCAQEDIDTLKTSILTTLKKSNPKGIDQFEKFFKQYDTVVTSFFDRANNESLAAHVSKMENELKLLDSVTKDGQFSCVKPILTNLHHSLSDLVDTLKSYINAGTSVFFALSVRRFKFLLPEDVKNRGEFSLFKSIRHRHNC